MGNPKMKIAVAGTGYVGLSLSVLLAQNCEVVAFDIDDEKVNKINEKVSPILDHKIDEYLSKKSLNLKATSKSEDAYDEASFLIVATPTNYDPDTNQFDTSSVNNVINDALKINPNIYIVIKSTVPIGFTDRLKDEKNNNNICFSPEFLREGKALEDNLYPSRIVMGDNIENARLFADLLSDSAIKPSNEIEKLFVTSSEAEAIKLFSNTFLAMRISYFNELDSFAEVNNLSSEKIIKGVSSDPRIGDYYNNPSFGYGGYCLPKDTKQLLKNYNKIPNNIIRAIVESNETRKEFIAKSILNKQPKIIGIYRLAMKKGSDNFRESAMLGVISKLKTHDVEIILYEPSINKKYFNKVKVMNDLDQFISKSDLIIANRFSDELKNAKDKVYSRDLFGAN